MANCISMTYCKNSIFYRRTVRAEFDINGNPHDEGINLNPDWNNCLYFFPSKQEKGNVREALDGYQQGLPFIMNAKYISREKPIKVICCKHFCFMEGSYENYMKDLIEEIEGIVRQKKGRGIPFMDWLGARGWAFQCYHDKSGIMEIIIPKLFFRGNNINNWNFTF